MPGLLKPGPSQALNSENLHISLISKYRENAGHLSGKWRVSVFCALMERGNRDWVLPYNLCLDMGLALLTEERGTFRLVIIKSLNLF
jgi:hypothetical protein